MAVFVGGVGRLWGGASSDASTAAYSLRNLACLLLVIYHVIGAEPDAGMKVDYPHGLRFLADALVDVRMPLFAFVAGAVYALRPIGRGSIVHFLLGKMRRLLIPGAVATLVFAGASGVVGTKFAITISGLWTILFFSYAHFWFLQCIFAIIIAYAVMDAFLGKHAAPALLITALIATLLYFHFMTSFWSLNSFVYLSLYFSIGILCVIYFNALQVNRIALLVLLFISLSMGIAMNISYFDDSGALNLHRHDLQSILTGASVCALGSLVAGHGQWLKALGPYTFTIYLYHVLGTSAARRALDMSGIHDSTLNLIAGCTLGLLLPICVHEVASRSAWTRSVILGLKR